MHVLGGLEADFLNAVNGVAQDRAVLEHLGRRVGENTLDDRFRAIALEGAQIGKKVISQERNEIAPGEPPVGVGPRAPLVFLRQCGLVCFPLEFGFGAALLLEFLEALEEQQPGDLLDVIEQAVGVVVLPQNLAGLPKLGVERFA